MNRQGKSAMTQRSPRRLLAATLCTSHPNAWKRLMVKLIFCLHRRPELSREAFQAYWRDKHAPLVASFASALGIRRYVQCHTLDESSFAAMTASRGSLPGYDGVAELWFDSLEQCLAARGPDARAAGRALLEDERRFIDLSRSPLFFASELPVHPPPASAP
jgi:uncharacterized protein (TIGR02118 family)